MWYFSGKDRLSRLGQDGWWFRDEYDETRVAYDADGTPWEWWLRSPGLGNRRAACVDDDGAVYVSGFAVHVDSIGVRPSLWIDLGD